MLRKFRIASIFIAVFLVLALATCASAEVAKLVLKCPEGSLYTTHFTATLYLGSGTTATGTNAVLNAAESNANQRVYDVNTFGAYNYRTVNVSGSGVTHYASTKLLYITQEQVANNEVIEMMFPGKRGDDHDSNSAAGIVPSDQQMASKWLGAVEGENAYFPTVGFITPRFVKPGYGTFQFTRYVDLEEFVIEQVAKNPKARLFYLADLIDDATGEPFGPTPRFGYRIPAVILSNTPIPKNATFEEAANIIRNNGKPTFLHQAQIHGNESAPAEGAQLFLADMLGKFGEKYLEKVNFVSIPRYNVEGAHLNTRGSAIPVVDMNRDHLRLRTQETRMVHKAYLLVMPEVINDSHELGSYSASTHANSTTRAAGTTSGAGITINNEDLESCPATSLNNPSQVVNDYAFDVFAHNMYNRLQADGVAIRPYGQTHNNSIGRAYFGLMGSVSILVEVRGQNTGVNMRRRAYAQLAAAKIMLDTLYENPEHIRNIIAQGRKDIVEKGKIFDPNVRAHLTMTSAKNSSQVGFTGNYYQVDLLGNMVYSTLAAGTNYNETAATDSSRWRPRATAYVIPKGMEKTTIAVGQTSATAANSPAIYYEWLENSMKWNGIKYYEIAPGTTVNLKQYYRTTTTNTVSSITADLRPAADVTFPDGAYVVPMDQLAGAVVLGLFEPDCAGSNGYNASVAQGIGDSETQVVIFHDINTRNYPYYRLEQSYPREVLPTPFVEADAFVKKLNGNKNELTVVVFEYYGNGDLKETYEKTFSIDNNAIGTYQVGPCKVYVDTKGNTQIRACDVVEWKTTF